MTETLTSLESLLRLPDSVVGTVFFGGCGEFGMNCTAYIYKKQTYIVDCGLMFSEAYHIGTDAVIPKLDTWLTQLGGVKAYLMTHGHEDHIGALPHILDKWPAPVYTTPWTAALIRDKYSYRNKGCPVPIHEVLPRQKIQVGDMETEWVHVNHSIPQTNSLAMEFGGKVRIYHTGDFKYEPDSIYEPPMDLERIKQIGDKGYHALVSDSTNAVTPGFSPGEAKVIPVIEKVFRESPKRIFFTTFASNLWRVRSVLEVCRKLKRRACLTGTGLKKVLRIAEELGLDNNYSDILIDEQDLKQNQQYDDLVVLATGCQGEHRSALARIVNDEHSFFKIGESDTVIFSSRAIPGNEKSIAKMVNECSARGARIISPRTHPDIHVSGHAYQEDIISVLKALRPATHIPVHGTFPHLNANRELTAALPSAATQEVKSGTVLTISPKETKLKGEIELAFEYVDSWSQIPMSYETLRERWRIGDSGMAVLSGVVSWNSKEHWLTPPELYFVGMTLPASIDEKRFKGQILAEVNSIIDVEKKSPTTLHRESLSDKIRTAVRRKLTDVFVKKPVVLVTLQYL